MRIASLCVLVVAAGLAACSKGPDSANAGGDPAPATGAAATPTADAGGAGGALAAGALDGTWDGETRFDTTTTTPYRWTAHIRGATVAAVPRGSTDSLRYRATFAGDSAVTVSDAFQMEAGGPMLVDHTVGRLRGGRIVGTGRIVRADAPDSVVARYRYEAAKAAPASGGS